MLRPRANFKHASFKKGFIFLLNNPECATVKVTSSRTSSGALASCAPRASTSNRVVAILCAHLVGGHRGFDFGHRSNVTWYYASNVEQFQVAEAVCPKTLQAALCSKSNLYLEKKKKRKGKKIFQIHLDLILPTSECDAHAVRFETCCLTVCCCMTHFYYQTH